MRRQSQKRVSPLARLRWAETGLSQTDFAKVLGIDRADLSRIEHGLLLLTSEREQAIAEAMGLTVPRFRARLRRLEVVALKQEASA
jgi:transcriptional regulator with XRE-family HTH domain